MIFKTHGVFEDLVSKCNSMSHEVYVWDIGVDSLKYIESVLLNTLATIVIKIIDKEDYLMLLLTSELRSRNLRGI